MNGLTREDMLRELELLPVWKLRQPVPALTQAPIAVAELETTDAVLVASVPEVSEVSEVPSLRREQTMADAVTDIAPAEIGPSEVEPSEVEPSEVEPSEVEPSEVEQAAVVAEPSRSLRALSNEDGTYLFLMQPTLSDEAAEMLLQNMLRAMRVICRIDIEGNVEHIFNEHRPKLIICFGEEAAHQLTQQSQKIAQWRTHQPHYFQQTPLIVTFTPQHLLQHHQDKALVWQDLCLAMQLVSSL